MGGCTVIMRLQYILLQQRELLHCCKSVHCDNLFDQLPSFAAVGGFVQAGLIALALVIMACVRDCEAGGIGGEIDSVYLIPLRLWIGGPVLATIAGGVDDPVSIAALVRVFRIWCGSGRC